MLEAELFSFLENTRDGVFAVRESGEICFWNRAAQGLFGYSEEESLGRTCAELLHGVGVLGTRVCHERCVELQCLLKPEPMPNFDLNVAVRGGERRWVNISTIASVKETLCRSPLSCRIRVSAYAGRCGKGAGQLERDRLLTATECRGRRVPWAWIRRRPADCGRPSNPE
ncbi:MAG: PAS domain-containing protein [Terracidiphilus sp.]